MIKASMNKGLSYELNLAFPEITLVERSTIVIVDQVIKNPYWLAGFASGEGSFMVNLQSSTSNLGFQVKLVFQLTQHSRDIVLINSLIEFFGSGGVYKDREFIQFKISKFSDITEIVIPFFNKFQIMGIKSQDFNDFVKIELMKNKAHLTSEGLDKIRKIQIEMNKGRQ